MASTTQNPAKPCTNSVPATKSKATNPFFVFLHEFRQDLTERGVTNFSVKEVACMAGERWRQMSPSDKLSYIVWARKNQQQQDSKLKIGSKAERNHLPLKSRKPKSKQKTLVRNRPSYIN